jgi:hypothetical protein
MLASTPNDLIIPVKLQSGGGSGVPFADVRDGVDLFPKHARPEAAFFRTVGTAGLLPFHAHRFDTVLVVPGAHRRARCHTPRSDVSIAEADYLRGECLNVRDLKIIGTP